MIISIFKKLFPLFVVQFFTWLALFALWIYATPVITKYYFNSTNSESIAFENGTQWVSICFALYATLAAFLTFFIKKVLKYISKEILHGYCLIIGGIGLFLIYYFRNKWSLMISFSFIGIAWSSIGNIPYRIVSSFDDNENENEIDIMTYFAVFNFSVVLPQIFASYFLNYVNKNLFHYQTIYIILLGSISMFTAGLCMFLNYASKK